MSFWLLFQRVTHRGTPAAQCLGQHKGDRDTVNFIFNIQSSVVFGLFLSIGGEKCGSGAS